MPCHVLHAQCSTCCISGARRASVYSPPETRVSRLDYLLKLCTRVRVITNQKYLEHGKYVKKNVCVWAGCQKHVIVNVIHSTNSCKSSYVLFLFAGCNRIIYWYQASRWRQVSRTKIVHLNSIEDGCVHYITWTSNPNTTTYPITFVGVQYVDHLQLWYQIEQTFARVDLWEQCTHIE